MPKIKEEIDQLAESMEKSTKTPKDQLMETIRELGIEGIKAKIPSLSKSEKEVLFDALEEMKKAASPAMDANYQAKYVQGNIKDTVIQEDKADDDQDEKLVNPANASMKHQGDNAPEGIEGQVIKAEKVDKDEKKEDKAAKKIAEAVDDMAENEAKEEVKEHEDKMHKKDMKKSVEINGKEIDLYELRTQAEEILKSEGIEELTVELVKGKMKAMLAEEKQLGDAPEMNEKTRAKKEKMPDQIEEGDANKMAQDKVDDMKQGKMAKSVVWADDNALLKAKTGGRNHHFSVNEYYDQVLTKSETPEELEKSEKTIENYDINDLIEKDMDTTWKDLETAQGIAKSIVDSNGNRSQSFSDNEIAEALGLTEEEAKELLGE